MVRSVGDDGTGLRLLLKEFVEQFGNPYPGALGASRTRTEAPFGLP
jgi:hypothetical protein